MFVLALVALLLVFVTVSARFGDRSFIVRSGSMGDVAPVGSLVITHPRPRASVHTGTIIAVPPATTSGHAVPTLHRIVSIEHTSDGVVARTKGDANNAVDPDPHVLRPTVLVPAHILPWAGYAVDATQRPAGWLLLILLPGFVLFISALRSIWAPTSEDADGTSLPASVDATVSPDARAEVSDAARHAEAVLGAAVRLARAADVAAHERLRDAESEAVAVVERAMRHAATIESLLGATPDTAGTGFLVGR
jgi:signal peptidase